MAALRFSSVAAAPVVQVLQFADALRAFGNIFRKGTPFHMHELDRGQHE
ncbi:hypothetical protein [Pelagibacterium luteolum]|nr:hypothetical protein [Pelagibacterium luteolum]